ncbi:MAG: ABC transporter ATP-binding protein [Planctomycetes bacterium]|nr:ABC transporter ATP-binding protein [Planctomycetota bacterium]
MKNNAIISAVGLTKVYLDFWRRARVNAVNDLDFEIHPGEIFGLLGPNGSGKSTTIKMILGLLHPTRGRVAVFGKPPDDVKIKARIGYLPEESYLYRYLNGREVLDFYGSLFQIHRQERRRRTEELLEMVGLKSAARRPVGEYSKGMARRIGLAQALINDPDLLILDEPTSGLDPIGSKLVKDVIARLGNDYGKTILLSSHLLADVEEVCGRVAILYGGVCRATGKLSDLLSRRDLTQITSDRLSPETIREIEALVKKREGKSVEVTAPSDKLESLFLRIVRDARQEQVATDGASERGDVAAFLGEDARPEDVLSSLVSTTDDKTEPIEREPATEKVDAGVLTDLAESGQASAESGAAEAPAAPQAAETDQALLDELSGGGSQKKDKS